MSRKRPAVQDFNSLFGDPLNMKQIKEKGNKIKEKIKDNGAAPIKPKKDKKKLNKNKDRDKEKKNREKSESRSESKPEAKPEVKQESKPEAVKKEPLEHNNKKQKSSPKKSPKKEAEKVEPKPEPVFPNGIKPDVAQSPTHLFASSDSELEGKLDSSLDDAQTTFNQSGNRLFYRRQPACHATGRGEILV